MSDPNDPFADFPDWARPKPKVDTSVLSLATPDPPPKAKGKGKRVFVKKEKEPDPNAPQPKGEAPKGHLEFWSYAYSEEGDYNFTHSKEFSEALEEAKRLLASKPDEGEARYVRASVYYGDKAHAFREAEAAWVWEGDLPDVVENVQVMHGAPKDDAPVKPAKSKATPSDPGADGASKPKRSRKKVEAIA